tara:strand:- start:41 stop:1309 length:1269 start_codon:yes stop_codon:yes gene_type:complete
MNKGIKTRLIIHDILFSIKKNIGTFNSVFKNQIKKEKLNDLEKKFIHNVTLNSIRNDLIIKEIINNLSNNKKLNINQYLILLSGITQIVFLNIKPHAVIFSMVEISKNKKFLSNSGLVNAILRKVNENKIKLKLKKSNFSLLPNWFKKNVNDWNHNTKNKFLDTIREQPGLHIVFKNKNDKINFTKEAISTSSKSIFLNSFNKIEKIKDFNKGIWWVQDYSAMLPISLLDNFSSKKIIDMCSAPGGKCFQILSTNNDIVLYEKNKQRSNILLSNLQRLNFKTQINQKDILISTENDQYDIVLLDAPCSAIGTIRRNPEIFFREDEIDIKNYVIIQQKLLNKAKKLVKKNGIILYMVCSFLKAETNQQINYFLRKNKNFSLKFFDINKSKLINKNGYFKTIPQNINNSYLIDGFFAAQLLRNE